MNILLVHYGPGDPSISTELAESLKPVLKTKGNLEILNLNKEIPDLFHEQNLRAYVKRNYQGKEISEIELKSLQKMDQMTDQLLQADILVMVFPMYNFTIPAAVKAWIDSVAQSKKTFRYTEYGPEGLLKIQKAIVLPVTGMTPLGSSKDFISGYMDTILKFMGIKEVVIKGITGTRYIQESKSKVDEIFSFVEGELKK